MGPTREACLDHRPALSTERLLLRTFSPDDAPDVARLCADREIASTTLLIPHPYTLDDARRFIETQAEAWASGTGAVFGVTLRESGEVLGAIGLHLEREHRRAELGYWIGVAHWNRGYATEAVKAVVRFGFEDLSLHRIHAHHFGRNPASGKVLLKAGFRHEGILRGHVLKWGAYEDCELYGIVHGTGEGEAR
jgi:RimJ/RimL family protein N-acetyltransferase